MKKYGYMIKTISKNFDAHGGFKYPKKKGSKIVAPDWNDDPVCNGGIFGLIHETEEHCINQNDTWLILKYEIGTEVIVDDSKIKVPFACVVDWGTAEEIQRKFEKLTSREYEYDYRVASAGYKSTLTAGYKSTLTAGNFSTLTAGYKSTLTAGFGSTLTAGFGSTLTAGYRSTLTAGFGSTLTAGDKSTLIIQGNMGTFENTGTKKITCILNADKQYVKQIEKGKYKLWVEDGKLRSKRLKEVQNGI